MALHLLSAPHYFHELCFHDFLFLFTTGRNEWSVSSSLCLIRDVFTLLFCIRFLFFWVNWIQCTLFPMRHQRQFNVDKIDHLFDSIFYFCFCFRCALFAVYLLHSVERHPCLLFSVRTQLNYIMILSPVDPYKIFQVSCKAFFRRPWVCFMVIKVWILFVYILLLPLSKYDSTSKETSANQSFGSGFMRFLFFKSFVVWHILAI